MHAAVQASNIEDRALLARAVVLVGSCGGKLPKDHWLHAFGFIVAVARHHIDRVVKLAAVSSLSHMMEQLITENEGIEEEKLFMRRLTSDDFVGGGADLQALLEMGVDGEAELAQRRLAYEEKVTSLTGHAQSLVQGCLVMLESMEEIESKVKIMRLLSLTFEVIGDRAQELLSLVADYLPRIWSSADGNSDKDTAKLHCALMGLLTHLVVRIKHLATEHPHVAKVMAPLLAHALTLGRPDSDVLVEDALKLLKVIITSSQQLSPEYKELLPKVMAILQKGKERGAIFSVLEGYILLGIRELQETIQPHMGTISQALLASVNFIAETITAEETAGPPMRQGHPLGMGWLRSAYQEQAGKRDMVQEGFAAASVLSLLLQLNVEPQALAPALKLMAKMASGAGVGAHAMRVRQFIDGARTAGSVVQRFVEVLTRALFNHPDSLAWLHGRSLGEVLGERDVCMIGRMRRHVATACLCKLVCSNASTALTHPSRAASLLSLGLTTLKENTQYQADQENMGEALSRQNRLFNECLLQVSLELARQDPIRSCNTQAVVTSAAQAIMNVCPEEEIWAHLEMIDTGLPPMLQSLLRGEYGDTSVISLAQALNKATL